MRTRSASFWHWMSALDLVADMLEGANKKTARSRRWIANQLLLPRVEQFDHEIDDRTGRKELPQLAAEGGAEKALEGQALDVVAGLGEVEALQLPDDAAEGLFRDVELVGLWRTGRPSGSSSWSDRKAPSWTSASLGIREAARRSR